MHGALWFLSCKQKKIEGEPNLSVKPRELSLLGLGNESQVLGNPCVTGCLSGFMYVHTVLLRTLHLGILHQNLLLLLQIRGAVDCLPQTRGGNHERSALQLLRHHPNVCCTLSCRPRTTLHASCNRSTAAQGFLGHAGQRLEGWGECV